MSEESKMYEIGYLLISPEAEREILGILNQHNCEIINQEELAEIRLAYNIKKQPSALFGFVQFKTLPENVIKIKGILSSNAKILRFIFIKLPPKTMIPEPRIEKPEPKVSEPKVSIPKPAVLTNEALEERLEEILK